MALTLNKKKLKERSKYGTVSSRAFDYYKSDHVSPSYFTPPTVYPCDNTWVHSGQTVSDTSVLNDTILCVGSYEAPTKQQRLLHTPSDYLDPKIRKNDFEVTLCRLEDDQFDVDMAIERNSSTVGQLQNLYEEVTARRGERRPADWTYAVHD